MWIVQFTPSHYEERHNRVTPSFCSCAVVSTGRFSSSSPLLECSSVQTSGRIGKKEIDWIRLEMTQAKLFNVFVICFIVVCMTWPVTIDGQGAQQIQNKTLVYKCDIVLILDDSGSITGHPGGEANFDRMLGVVRKFPDYFIMGENHTRAAIIVFSTESRILLSLTADDRLVRNFSTNATWGGTYTDLALKDAKEKVFANARPNAMRIVILITDGGAYDKKAAEDVSKQLREEGTLIYVAFIGEDYHTNRAINDHINNVAGDRGHVFPIGSFDDLTSKIFEEVEEAIRCTYQEGCLYSDSSLQSCVGGYWRPLIDGTNCTQIPPDEPPKIKCELIHCEMMCNGWPWEEERECQDEDAGKNLTINRGQRPKGNEQMFKHCPKEKVKTCPPKTTEPPTTTESPTTTEPPNPIESLTEAPPGTEKAAEVEAESTSSVMTEWWVILLMVIIILLVLTSIVLGVIAINRKRKKKAAAAAFMAKKKAAMEIPSSSDPPSMIEGRKRRPPGQPMEFSESGSVIDNSVADGKGRPRNRMVQFGYEKAAEADHSVQVSLAMDEKGRSPKKAGVKSASGKIADVKSISPVVKKSVDTKAAV